jgi:hypothetical protein
MQNEKKNFGIFLTGKRPFFFGRCKIFSSIWGVVGCPSESTEKDKNNNKKHQNKFHLKVRT